LKVLRGDYGNLKRTLNSRIIITLILLTGAVLTFTGLAIPTIPVTITRKVTQTYTEMHRSYATTTSQITKSTTVKTIIETMSYSQSVTASFTLISRKLMPASETLGLTGPSFYTLTIIVLGIMSAITIWLISKLRTKRGQFTAARIDLWNK